MKAITTKLNAARTRVIADDGDGNRATVVRESVQLEELHAAAAQALCKKMGWSGRLVGGYVLKNGATVARVWVWDDSRALRMTVTKEAA